MGADRAHRAGPPVSRRRLLVSAGGLAGLSLADHLRLEAAAGRLPELPILLLLDREADRHIAQRADADAVLVKPVDAGQLRRAIKRLLSPVRAVEGEA